MIAKGDGEENMEVKVPMASGNLSTENPSTSATTNKNISSDVLDWPLAEGIHIAANFTTGFYIGEVLSTNGDTARVRIWNYIKP